MKKEKKTNFKGIIYTFLGVILVLVFVIGFKFNQFSKNNSLENEKLLQKINQLTENYKRDSTEFVKANSTSLAKMKKELKDSVLNDLALNYSKEIETIKKEAKKATTTVAKQKKSTKKIQSSKSKYSSNVTTYTKLPNYKTNNNNNKSYTSNVTTYTKLDNTPKSNTSKFSSNVTSYTKLPNYNKTTGSKATTSTIPSKTKSANIIKSSTKKTTPKLVTYTASTKKLTKIQHGIPALDNAYNINTVEFSPIYPGCKSKLSEKDRKNCLNTKISNYVYGKFDVSKTKNLDVSKGLNELRVLFVIDKNGKSKGIRAVGKWHPEITKEAKRVINTLPKMIPGKKNGQYVAVKYSIKVPFIVK